MSADLPDTVADDYVAELRRALVFIDTETTGLSPLRHEVVEVAWAVDDGDVQTLVLPHSLSTPDARALKLNGYLDRDLFDVDTWASATDIGGLYADLNGATLVGANPGFDAGFLRAFFASEQRPKPDPWHYRLLDVQAFGMGVLDLEEMPGLADLVRLLRERGEDIPASDHTAAADVTATRAVFWALRAAATR